jgi:hypothetical protein
MEEKRNAYRVSVGKSKGKGLPGNPRVGRRILIRWILEK